MVPSRRTRFFTAALGSCALLAALPSATAAADPKSPDCAVATKLNNESRTSFGTFSSINVSSKRHDALNLFHQHVDQGHERAKDEELQSVLADVSGSAAELSGLAEQLQADSSVWGTRDFTFAVNAANEHARAAGQALTDVTNAVCS